MKSIAGAAIASAHVFCQRFEHRFSPRSSEGVASAPDGSYVLELPSGAYEISVTAEGFGTKTPNVTVPQQGEQNLLIELTRASATVLSLQNPTRSKGKYAFAET